MKVRELIKELSKQDPYLDVVINATMVMLGCHDIENIEKGGIGDKTAVFIRSSIGGPFSTGLSKGASMKVRGLIEELSKQDSELEVMTSGGVMIGCYDINNIYEDTLRLRLSSIVLPSLRSGRTRQLN